MAVHGGSRLGMAWRGVAGQGPVVLGSARQGKELLSSQAGRGMVRRGGARRGGAGLGKSWLGQARQGF